MRFRWYLPRWQHFDHAADQFAQFGFLRLPGPMREKSNSFSVIPLQRKASVWIIRR